MTKNLPSGHLNTRNIQNPDKLASSLLKGTFTIRQPDRKEKYDLTENIKYNVNA
jgi:hypothetical protein